MPTKCHREDCPEHAHVLLFATGERFLNRNTIPGQAIYLCLGCGGQLYDVLKAWRDQRRAHTPTWLVDDLKADRLPSILPDRRWQAQTPPRPRRRHPALRERPA